MLRSRKHCTPQQTERPQIGDPHVFIVQSIARSGLDQTLLKFEAAFNRYAFSNGRFCIRSFWKDGFLPGSKGGPGRKGSRMKLGQFTQREIDDVESCDDAVRMLVQPIERTEIGRTRVRSL